MYILRRLGDGKYVAKRGLGEAYTEERGLAAEFRTEEEAEKSRCGNESIYWSGCEERLVKKGEE
jgi:hypothetical protein